LKAFVHFQATVIIRRKTKAQQSQRQMSSYCAQIAEQCHFGTAASLHKN
jgi:hypothetical protein